MDPNLYFACIVAFLVFMTAVAIIYSDRGPEE